MSGPSASPDQPADQTEWSGPLLALLLSEANGARGAGSREAGTGEASLSAALALADGQPPPRVAWLVQHLSVLKRACWETLSAHLGTAAPPAEFDLSALCRWEEGQAAVLTREQLASTVQAGGQPFKVSGLLRLNARNTVWIAGQIAALCRGPRLA
ncbi:hypothetical protein [Deinococcus altitudinis]|uniref:hypothetical protein n=1 Tax=Deinococcus altitudinis TaxID=468914 RepID=UPI0038929892